MTIVSSLCLVLGCAAAFGAAALPTRKYGKKKPLREGIGAVLGAACGAALLQRYPPAAALTFGVFFALLWAVACIDADTQEIPDVFHLILLALSAVSCYTITGISLWARLIGLLCVSVPMLALTLWKEGAFGGGDIKLMACCGLLMGWRLCLLGAFFGILGGGAWGAWLLLRRRAARTDHFAFAPFLCAGMAASVLWGDAVLAWYLRPFGF